MTTHPLATPMPSVELYPPTHGGHRRGHRPGVLRLLRDHPWSLLAATSLWTLAFVRVFVDPTPRLPLVFNWTGSLPYHVAWVSQGRPTPARGDYVLFAFDGPERTRHPGLQGQPFFKRIGGMAGDVIQVNGRHVFVNGAPMGLARTHTFDHQPLSPIAAGVIPADHYYVQGSSPDSFDSRYRESGLVRSTQVLATVTPIF